MSWYDSYGKKECPTNSRDAYWEGRDSRSWDRNPYEQGRDAFASHDCREAYEEWQRGHRAAEDEREEHAREEEQEARQERMKAHEMEQQQEVYYEEPSYPEPPDPELESRPES